MNNKKITSSLIVISGIVLIFVIAYKAGQNSGKNEGRIETETKFAPIIDLAFPQPPAEMKSLNGKILSITGATVNLEINSPEDYLPHTNGTPHKTETRFATITKYTKIVFIDFTQLDINGNPQKTELASADLVTKIGSPATVYSEQNIRSMQKFDVIQIEIAKY